MNALSIAQQPLTTTFYPAVAVADYTTAEAAFLAAGCPIPLATVAAQELTREPTKVACVDIAVSVAEGGQRPQHPAWFLLNPEASQACVAAKEDGSVTLFAGYAAKELADEASMEWLIRECQRATGLRWLAIVQARMPWIAAQAARSSPTGPCGLAG